jgi:DNA-binding NarL/FixJ family response regulator
MHELRNSIQTVAMNNELERQTLLSLVERAIAICPGASTSEPTHQRLSPREKEVMTMILSGRRLKEIAAQLDISVKTVTTHRSRLLRKIGVEDNLGLYRYGVRNGLISV